MPLVLSDFKLNILVPLLRGERLAEGSPQFSTEPLALFAAELDNPLDSLFESDRWQEVYGASARVQQGMTKLRGILAADGYPEADLLHSDGSGVLALVHDRALADRWREAVERAIATETELVTVSTVVQPVTVQQLERGLYGSPRTVIGVPGVNDYQDRINRYYGLANPSTIPREDAISQRRHFGEVVGLMRGLMIREHESRQIFPFYEALPYAERCDSCRVRPAERLEPTSGELICGVCTRKRKAAPSGVPKSVGLVWLEAWGLDRLLEQQRTVAAYRRLYRDLDEALHLAIPDRLGVVTLSAGAGRLVLAIPAANALEATTALLEALAIHYNHRPPTALIAAVTLPMVGHISLRGQIDLAQRTIGLMRRGADVGSVLLDVRGVAPSQPFDRFRKPYSTDEARRLLAGVAILRDQAFPDNFLADLPEQSARGNGALYTIFERSKLTLAQQDSLKRLESTWDSGPRFYTMLGDALLLARLARLAD